MASSVKPTRVAFYARVSTKDQDVALQLEDLRAAAAVRGWVTVGEFTDISISGAKRARPGLDTLLAEAQAGSFDVVLVWKMDRLARSLQHLLATLKDLTDWGVGFASLRDPGIDTTTASGRLMLQILGAFAEFEREIIRERVKAGVDRARRQGKRLGRPPKVFVSMEKIQPLLARGLSVRAIARELEAPEATVRGVIKRCAESSRPAVSSNPLAAGSERPVSALAERSDSTHPTKVKPCPAE